MEEIQSARAAWYEDTEGRPGARIGDEFILNDNDLVTAPAVGKRVWLLTLAGGLLNSRPTDAGSVTAWSVQDHRILSPERPAWFAYDSTQGP